MVTIVKEQITSFKYAYSIDCVRSPWIWHNASLLTLFQSLSELTCSPSNMMRLSRSADSLSVVVQKQIPLKGDFAILKGGYRFRLTVESSIFADKLFAWRCAVPGGACCLLMPSRDSQCPVPCSAHYLEVPTDGEMPGALWCPVPYDAQCQLLPTSALSEPSNAQSLPPVAHRCPRSTNLEISLLQWQDSASL